MTGECIRFHLQFHQEKILQGHSSLGQGQEVDAASWMALNVMPMWWLFPIDSSGQNQNKLFSNVINF